MPSASTLTFSAATTGNPTTIEWMIGSDSRTGAGPMSFTPTAAGDLAWSVTASNGAGSATAKGQLHIVDARPPTAQFTAAAKVAVNTATTFTDQSTGSSRAGRGRSTVKRRPTSSRPTWCSPTWGRTA